MTNRTTDRSETIAALTAALDTLYAKRDTIAAAKADAVAARDSYTAALDKAIADLRATTDGLALSMRAIEIAMLRKAPPAELRRLRRDHQRAEAASSDEYSARLTAWGYRAGDGPARGITVGDGPVRAALLRDGVVGYYRRDDGIARIRVTLLRTVENTKLSTWLLVDNADPLTLAAVFADAFTHPRTASRITARLRLDHDRYESLSLPRHTPATA